MTERPTARSAGSSDGAAARQLFGTTFAVSPLGLGVIDADGAWLDVNEAMCSITGRHAGTLVAMTVHEVTAPEDHYRDLVERRQLAAGELTGYQVETRWLHADGSRRWVRLSVSRGPTEGPAARTFAVQVQDVTAQRETEDRARLLGDLVECSAEAIWARDGGGEIVYWNHAAAELLGYEPADVLGRSDGSDLPDHRVAETARVLAIAAGGLPVGPVDTVRRHKDGHEVDVSLTVSPIHDADGQLLGFASVARDTVERRQAHEELSRRADALEAVNGDLRRSNEDLQQFIGAASHDLAQPLRSVSGAARRLAQLLRSVGDEPGRGIDDETALLLATIGDGTVRMRQLLDALLVYARLTAQPLSPGTVDIDALVADVLAGLDLRLLEAGADIRLDPLPPVTGDVDQLAEVIRQLVSNALVHGRGEHGVVIALSAERLDDRVLVHVDDGGPGIDPDQRERVFRLFTQVRGREHLGGTGLGLALVRRLVDRLHGAVTVGSGPLGGARFTVALPSVPSPMADPAGHGPS